MNAIVFQIRPQTDAFYPSEINQWSRWLTGEERKDPGWDPLEWMIEETNKRHVEFHALFNPYQIHKYGLHEVNFAVKNPQYVLEPDYLGSNGIYPFLNPGESAVQDHIVETILEVVNNYDVDAAHIDDYFYPYGRLSLEKDCDTYLIYREHPSQDQHD